MNDKKNDARQNVNFLNTKRSVEVFTQGSDRYR